jgi:hypothetical protein
MRPTSLVVNSNSFAEPTLQTLTILGQSRRLPFSPGLWSPARALPCHSCKAHGHQPEQTLLIQSRQVCNHQPDQLGPWSPGCPRRRCFSSRAANLPLFRGIQWLTWLSPCIVHKLSIQLHVLAEAALHDWNLLHVKENSLPRLLLEQPFSMTPLAPSSGQ